MKQFILILFLCWVCFAIFIVSTSQNKAILYNCDATTGCLKPTIFKTKATCELMKQKLEEFGTSFYLCEEQ